MTDDRQTDRQTDNNLVQYPATAWPGLAWLGLAGFNNI